MKSRRSFINKSIAIGLGAMVFPEIAKGVVEKYALNTEAISPKKNDIILFQGDSITDCGRDRKSNVYNKQEQLGAGYVLFTAASILKKYAAEQPKIFNRGISGNKVFEMKNRWTTDTLDLKPNILSILIGVNDHWHTLDGHYNGTVETYIDDYRSLLEQTKTELPSVKLIICEPFVLKGGTAINESNWFPAFDKYRESAKKLANEFNAIFVPFQSAFDEALKLAPAEYWAIDGVHPDLPGRQLMAEVWMEAAGLNK